MRRARILRAIHAMAESGNLDLARQLAANRLVDALGRRVLADLDEQPHHIGIRAAVERSLERADGADDGRVEVGEGRGRDARGERRRVQLVVGVQHQRDVEGARRERARPRPGQHVEKVRRVPERRIRLDGTAAGLQPAVGRDQARQLRGQTHRLAVVRLRRVVGRVRVEVAEDRSQRPQRVHAVALAAAAS